MGMMIWITMMSRQAQWVVHCCVPQLQVAAMTAPTKSQNWYVLIKAPLILAGAHSDWYAGTTLFDTCQFSALKGTSHANDGETDLQMIPIDTELTILPVMSCQ
jgi:hypothetical protein